MIIIKVKNSKAPYTDSFYIRYKKVVETKDESTFFVKCRHCAGIEQSKAGLH